MTHNTAIDSPQGYSLLPADDEDTSAPRAGFLARLEAGGAAPGVVRSAGPRQRSLARWAVLVLLAAVAAIAAWLYLSPEPSPATSAAPQAKPLKPVPPRPAEKTTDVPELPVSAESLALAALTNTDRSPLETFSALAGLTTDIDALAAAQASETLPASMADDWQPEEFASVQDIDAEALDAIPVPTIKTRRAAPARRSRQDSDAELLEMLMRRLDQGN